MEGKSLLQLKSLSYSPFMIWLTQCLPIILLILISLQVSLSSVNKKTRFVKNPIARMELTNRIKHHRRHRQKTRLLKKWNNPLETPTRIRLFLKND